MGPDLSLLGGQGNVEEVGAGSEVLEGERDVGAIVVPSQAVLIRRTHLVVVDVVDLVDVADLYTFILKIFLIFFILEIC